MVQRFGIRAGKQSLHEVELPTRELATQYTSMPGWRSALTLLYASMGREAEARQEFEAFAVNNFAGVPRNAYWLVTLTNLAQACVILRDVSRAAHLYQLLLPFAAQYVVVPPGLLCVGAVARFLGLLAMLQQRWEEAEAHFTAAVQRNTLLGAPPKVAITQRCYAAMLIARQWPGDREQAIALLHEALATSQSLGMDEQVRHVRGLLEQAQAQCTAVTPTSALTPPAQRPTYVFRQEGDYWTICDNATLFRLKHVRGLPYLRHLLQHPHQEVHVFDLVALAQASTSCAAVAPPPFARGTPPHRGDLGDAGDVLDVQARTAYKQRLHELQAELQVAQDTNDLGRQTLVQEEIEMLLQQLSAAVGLGGRSRHAASPAERARINVTNGIRMALTKMAAHSPPLVQYLTTTIKTGLICSYTPLPHAPILWEF